MNKGKILLTGGCGYIGAHTAIDLIENGFEVISVDNHIRSDVRIVKQIESITGKRYANYKVDLSNRTETLDLFSKEKDIIGIIHFAALKSVPESVVKPLLYYRNNMDSLFNILEAVNTFHIPNFVFSSSCSVYGLVDHLPVTEDTPFGEAQCAYARSKQHGEQVIIDIVKAGSFKANLLRYFNPVGAHISGKLGEVPIDVPNNLVPFITQTAIGKRAQLTVFGGDYPTRDGSCIRDYIHVSDIAHAHTLALEHLIQGKQSATVDVYNLGTGKGVSVLEAIHAFEKVSGVALNYVVGPRRPGDVIEVYADNTKASNQLGWNTQYDIEDMMLSAWQWEKTMLQLGW